MSQTLLVPMIEPEFEAYLAQVIPDYAQDKVRSGQWAEAEALALSRQDYAASLPQGLATPDQHLYSLRAADSGAAVGILWFAAQVRGGQQIAYVYDIVVHPAHQRQGHAMRAFAALEDEVRRLGLSGIALHVFGHNAGAIALYTRLGFVPTNINMFKALTRDTLADKEGSHAPRG